MTPYVFSLVLGGAGLAVMATAGLGHHGDAHGHHGHHGHQGHGAHDGGHALRDAAWALTSPRVLFSLLVGFGATGLLARPFLGGVALAAVAVLGAVAFERLLVGPLWRFLFRFASAPARTLETALLDEARAASGFDAGGQGLVALEVDGQVVQVLGTLRAEDRALGLRVRAGDRLRVEDVDAARGRCTVSFLGR